MSDIHRSALVPRSAAHMYGVVVDVAAYPSRFTWCEGVDILEATAKTQVARLRLGLAGLTTEFTTRNTLTPHSRITLALVDGPFTALSGTWTFKSLGDDGCKVSLDLEFEVASGLIGSALAIGFTAIADRMVDDFVRAALAA